LNWKLKVESWKLKVETWKLNWKLKSQKSNDIWNLKVELKVEQSKIKWYLKVESWIETWNLKLELKLENLKLETWSFNWIQLSSLTCVTGMIADMPSHIRTLFLFLDPVRILSCFASSSHHSDSLSIHSCLRSYRREYNKETSLITCMIHR
jgi:hypothetical protein